MMSTTECSMANPKRHRRLPPVSGWTECFFSLGISSAAARVGCGPDGGAGTSAPPNQSGGSPGGDENETAAPARRRNKRMRQTAYACRAKNKDRSTKRQRFANATCENANCPLTPPIRVVQNSKTIPRLSRMIKTANLVVRPSAIIFTPSNY